MIRLVEERERERVERERDRHRGKGGEAGVLNKERVDERRFTRIEYGASIARSR